MICFSKVNLNLLDLLKASLIYFANVNATVFLNLYLDLMLQELANIFQFNAYALSSIVNIIATFKYGKNVEMIKSFLNSMVIYP
jgi:hypothetical protein